MNLLENILGNEIDQDDLKKASKNAILKRDSKPLIKLLDRNEVQKAHRDAALKVFSSAAAILSSI